MPLDSAFTQLTQFARSVAPTLDSKTYYELLNLTPDASIPDVRAAYYRLAGQLHPDRYVGLPDRAAKDMLETIYARITEAYRVLSDPGKRKSYDEALPTGRTRFNSSTRETKGPQRPEEGLKHPEAKKFFRLGLISIDTKDWKGAVMNLNFARAYEPTAALIASKLDEAKARLAEVTAAAAAKVAAEKAAKKK